MTKDNELDSPCWLGTCETCKSGCRLILDQEDHEIVYWKQLREVTRVGKGEQLSMSQKSGCVGQLKEELFEAWPDFQEHVRVKGIQFQAFEKDKINPNSHVLQCDFAMAYSCEYQNEIQSGLWSRNGVNLFTAALYSNQGCCKFFLIVIDSQDKGKDSVYAFIMKLTGSLIDFKKGEDLIIYTDGPASEFKNRYMVKMVSILSKIWRGSAMEIFCHVSWQGSCRRNRRNC